MRGGERDGRSSIGGDGRNARHFLIVAGRVYRDGDRPGIETAEEGSDVIEPGGIEKQHALATRLQRLEKSGHGSCAAVEIAVAQLDFIVLTVDQKRVGQLVRLHSGPPAKKADDGRKLVIYFHFFRLVFYQTARVDEIREWLQFRLFGNCRESPQHPGGNSISRRNHGFNGCKTDQDGSIREKSVFDASNPWFLLLFLNRKMLGCLTAIPKDPQFLLG